MVRDRDGTAYRSDVLLQQLGAGAWDRFLDMAVDRAGHIAALLDREMPPHLVEDAAGAGVDLLPGIGDLEPECTCEAWDHCPHSGALCYQVARLLDEDPFVLLLMRGREERRLLDELQVRSAARAVRAGGGGAREGADDAEREVRGVPADEAFAAAGILPPLPTPRRSPVNRGSGLPWTRRPSRRQGSTRRRWRCSRPTARCGPTGCCWTRWPRGTKDNPSRSG